MLAKFIDSTRATIAAAVRAEIAKTAVSTAVAAPAGGAQAGLGFCMQDQTQTQWCWAATAVGMSLFYNPSSTWTQCSLVNRELGQTTCCQDGSSAVCNRPWYLQNALQTTGNLVQWVAGAASFADVQQEINAKRPLAARIGWSGGGGHFVVLDGYDTTAGQYLSVQDPWYGHSTYSYLAFQTAYQGSGEWTHSYYTKA